MKSDMIGFIRALELEKLELMDRVHKIDNIIAMTHDTFGGQLTIPQTIAETVIGLTDMPESAGLPANENIGQAAVEHLKRVGSPLKTRALASALENAGVQNSKNLYRAVYNALLRNKSAKLLPDARWGLAEWEGTGK